MKIVKIAGRLIKVYVMGVKLPDGTIVKKVTVAQGQELGGNCHGLTKHMLPNSQVTNEWSDPARLEPQPENQPEKQQEYIPLPEQDLQA